MERKINLISLFNQKLSDKESGYFTSGATCHSTGCSAVNANVMANKVLANLSGQNPPPKPRPGWDISGLPEWN